MQRKSDPIPAPLAPSGEAYTGLKDVGELPRFATIRAISALVLREMSTTFGRSPGGYIWAILEPALAVGVMVVIFSFGFRSPPIGTNFAIYYATGFMPFFMFISTSTKVSQAINFSNQLLSYPRVTFWDAVMARFILACLTQLMVSYLLLSFILIVWDTRTILDLPVIAGSFAMAAALGLGVGLLNCVLTSRYVIWHTVWAVLTRPLVLVSGVILSPSIIPQPYRGWLEWNPLLHVTGQSRKGFYHSYDGAYVDPIYALTVAIICGAFGLLFLRRFFRDNLER
jgi:capsular polysaccharide transport system permease protein